VAVSAGRDSPQRDPGTGHVRGAARGDRPPARARGGARIDAALAALPAAAAPRALERPPAVYRPEADLVPAPPRGRREPCAPRRLGPAGIRCLALGRLLGAGAGSRAFQAEGLPSRPERTRTPAFRQCPLIA